MEELFEKMAADLADKVSAIVLERIRTELSDAAARRIEFGWLEDALAEKLGCSSQSLAKARKAGHIDSTTNPAGRVFYTPQHVAEYLMRNQTRNLIRPGGLRYISNTSTKEQRDETTAKAA